MRQAHAASARLALRAHSILQRATRILPPVSVTTMASAPGTGILRQLSDWPIGEVKVLLAFLAVALALLRARAVDPAPCHWPCH